MLTLRVNMPRSSTRKRSHVELPHKDLHIIAVISSSECDCFRTFSHRIFHT